jgi:hypothetical protein
MTLVHLAADWKQLKHLQANNNIAKRVSSTGGWNSSCKALLLQIWNERTYIVKVKLATFGVVMATAKHANGTDNVVAMQLVFLNKPVNKEPEECSKECGMNLEKTCS